LQKLFRNRSKFFVILSLFLIITILIAYYGKKIIISTKFEKNQINAATAYYLAKSGVEFVIAENLNDLYDWTQPVEEVISLNIPIDEKNKGEVKVKILDTKKSSVMLQSTSSYKDVTYRLEVSIERKDNKLSVRTLKSDVTL
jgi:ABC-type Na+ efflux pump permease subunit